MIRSLLATLFLAVVLMVPALAPAAPLDDLPAVTLDQPSAPVADSPMLASVGVLGVAGVVAGRSLANHAPTSVAALDARDPNAGNASHVYGVQYGGPSDMVKLQFQHGPRGVPGSTAGVFDDDLLAIIEDRLLGFQSGPYACAENAEALAGVQQARDALARRVAARIAKGVLGVNATH